MITGPVRGSLPDLVGFGLTLLLVILGFSRIRRPSQHWHDPTRGDWR